MRILITGSQGNIGRRLAGVFPETIGIDIRPGADIRANLEFIDYEAREVRRALETSDALIHLASSADPGAAADVHWQDVVNASRLFSAAMMRGVKTLVVASSDTVAPDDEAELTTFSHCKRVIEIMAAMFDHEEGRRGRPVRIGWVARDGQDVEAASSDLQNRAWSDKRLIAAFRRALGS